MTLIPEGAIIDLMSPRSAQAESPLTGTADITLAVGVRVLWLTQMGSKRSYFWPDPDTAPTATLTADDTFTRFVMPDGTADPNLAIPWFVQKRFDSIEIKVTFAHEPSGAILSLRPISETLVTSVATTTGATAQQELGWGYTRWGKWAQKTQTSEFGRWRISQAKLELNQLTLPADRRVSLSMQAARTTVDPAWGTLSVTTGVKLVALSIYDTRGGV